MSASPSTPSIRSCIAGFWLLFATAASAVEVTIDASMPAPAPVALPFAVGGKSPSGH